MKKWKLALLMGLLEKLLDQLTPEMLRSAVDAIIDPLENLIERSETELDDAIALPIIAMIRTTFDIPDDDDPPTPAPPIE